MKRLVYPLTYDNREMLFFYDDLKKECSTTFGVRSNDDIILRYQKRNEEIPIVNYRDKSEFEKAVSQADVIVLVEGAKISEYNEVLCLAEGKEKRIQATQRVIDLLKDENLDKIEMLRKKQKLEDMDEDELYPIHVPVIAVMGLGSYCDKFINELYLGAFFKHKGYRVLQYGTKDIAELFGFEQLPSVIFDSCIPITKRILMLNHSVARECAEQEADIIIVGVHDGIMPINHAILNNFGENAFVETNALSVDYAIVGIYYSEEIDSEFMQYINHMVSYKLDAEVAGYCISNTFMEIAPESMGRKARYYHLDIMDDFCPHDLPSEEFFLYHVNSDEYMSEMAERIYGLLCNNIESVF